MHSIRVRVTLLTRNVDRWTHQLLDVRAPTLKAAHAVVQQRMMAAGQAIEPGLGQEMLIFVGHTEVYMIGEGADSLDAALAKMKEKQQAKALDEILDQVQDIEILPDKGGK